MEVRILAGRRRASAATFYMVIDWLVLCCCKYCFFGVSKSVCEFKCMVRVSNSACTRVRCLENLQVDGNLREHCEKSAIGRIACGKCLLCRRRATLKAAVMSEPWMSKWNREIGEENAPSVCRHNASSTKLTISMETAVMKMSFRRSPRDPPTGGRSLKNPSVRRILSTASPYCSSALTKT